MLLAHAVSRMHHMAKRRALAIPPIIKDVRLMPQRTKIRGQDHLPPCLVGDCPALMLLRHILLVASRRFHFRRTTSPVQNSNRDRTMEPSTHPAVDRRSMATHPPCPSPYPQLCLPQTAFTLPGASRTTVRNPSASRRSRTLPFCRAHPPSTPGIFLSPKV